MKTLDEVIDDLRLKSNLIICSKKKYDRWDVPIETMQEVLHYLQDYRMLVNDFAEKRQELEDEKARYQEAVKNCEETENKYRKAEQDALKALDDWASRPLEENKKLALTEDNPPLTWKQLKQMEGKPVWLEVDGYLGLWTIVHWNSNIVFMEYYDWLASPKDFRKAPVMSLDDTNFGTTWQAYRKER